MAFNNQCLPLSERIKLLKQDAERNQIFSKASEIAKILGQTLFKAHGAWHDWSNDEMSINYDDYGNNLFIDYRGVKVFCVHLGQIETYRPDVNASDWIQKIDEIYYSKIKPKIDKEIQEEKDIRAKELLDKWGLVESVQKVDKNE